MFKLLGTLEKAPVLMRDAYCKTLMELAKTNKDIVALDADLVGSSAYFWSMVQYVPSTSPSRSYQAGIMNITGRYVYIEGYDKRYAFSVRCILDSQGNL